MARKTKVQQMIFTQFTSISSGSGRVEKSYKIKKEKDMQNSDRNLERHHRKSIGLLVIELSQT